MQLCRVGVNFGASGFVRFLGSLSFHLRGSGSGGKNCSIICHGHYVAKCNMITTTTTIFRPGKFSFFSNFVSSSVIYTKGRESALHE